MNKFQEKLKEAMNKEGSEDYDKYLENKKTIKNKKVRKEVKQFFNSLFADIIVTLLIYLAYELRLEPTFNLVDLNYLDVVLIYFIFKIMLK